MGMFTRIFKAFGIFYLILTLLMTICLFFADLQLTEFIMYLIVDIVFCVISIVFFVFYKGYL